MPSDRLTELGIRKSTCGPNQKKMTDGKGLFLLLHPNGSKYWRMKYQFSGKEKTLAFGVWPEVSLTEAREMRNEAKLLLKDGKDPSGVKKSQKLNQKIQNSNTFGSITQEWLLMKKKEWKEAHSHDVQRALEIHVLPDLANRPITEIDSTELLAVLKKIEDLGKFEAAHRARQKVDAIFRYAALNQRCEQNPAVNLKGALVTPKRSKQKALEESDLPEFFKKINEYDGAMITKLGLRMVLLTLARTTEIRYAIWGEFELDSDSAVWRIPGENLHYSPTFNEIEDYIDSYSGRVGQLTAFFKQYTQGRKDLTDKIESIKLPVKVFWGDEDGFLKVENAHQLHSKLPKSSLHIFENCGHFCYQDQSSAFSNMIQNWVIQKQYSKV